VTVTVSDGMQTATRTFTWTVTAGGAADTIAPAVAITTPTTATTFSTSAATLSLGGTASDNVGVTQVTWSNSRGGSGTATGTANWSASVGLQSGLNVVTVTARDAAGNTSTDTLTVTYTVAASFSVKITSDKPSPQKWGAYVVFTVTTTGGVSPFSYQWRVFDGVSWRVLEPWRSDGVRTATWRVPAVKGAYTMEASARDKNGAISTTTVPFQVN
jgi:glucodextranase-like protein